MRLIGLDTGLESYHKLGGCREISYQPIYTQDKVHLIPRA